MKNFIRSYFSGSFKEMVSFFAKEDNLTVRDLNELMKDVIEAAEKEKEDE
jgi:hypothetical protein